MCCLWNTGLKIKKKGKFFSGEEENSWKCDCEERFCFGFWKKLPRKAELIFIWPDSEVIYFICCFWSVECMDWNPLISSACSECCKYYATLVTLKWAIDSARCMSEGLPGIVVCMKCPVALGRRARIVQHSLARPTLLGVVGLWEGKRSRVDFLELD